jgi:hypothetical protein
MSLDELKLISPYWDFAFSTGHDRTRLAVSCLIHPVAFGDGESIGWARHGQVWIARRDDRIRLVIGWFWLN